MLQHVAYDEWQVFLSYNLLAVAQFGNALRHTSCLFGSEFQSEQFQVLGDVCPTAIFTKCILALTSETLWHKIIAVKVVLIVAIGMNAFFIPFQLLSSGLSGIAIMFYFLTGLPVGIGIFILNIPIMIACYKFMGRSYTVLSIVGTIMLSVLVDVTSFLSTWNIMHDAMLSSITGGILSGIGFGIIYKYNGNSGGLDVIGAIVKKYYSLEMGTVTMILNLVILLAAAWLFSLERAVLTFVAIYIAAFITNKVVIGLKQRKSVIIISNRATPIAQVLMRYVGHGATYLHGQGAYTMQDKRVIYAVIKLTEVAKVKEIVNKLDPQAFMIISDASEVVGRGFTTSPVKYHQYPGDALSMPHTKKNMPPEY